MLRIMSISYNEERECPGCTLRGEKQVSTYILSYQIAGQLLNKYRGEWSLTENGIVLQLKGLDYPIIIEVGSGALSYGTLAMRFFHRYSPEKGVKALANEICSDLGIPSQDDNNESEFLFNTFVKLVEIFHAPCDLRIVSGKTRGEWEILLGQDGPLGWIGEDNIAENRFGEKIDISQWKKLRLEKVATYIFEFNRFCNHLRCPMK